MHVRDGRRLVKVDGSGPLFFVCRVIGSTVSLLAKRRGRMLDTEWLCELRILVDTIRGDLRAVNAPEAGMARLQAAGAAVHHTIAAAAKK